MKEIKYLIGIVVLLTLLSCGEVTEEIYINEDGSGTYSVSYDMIDGMSKMAVEMAKAFAEMSDEPVDMDELERGIRDGVWEDFPAVVDSIIPLETSIPDSVLNDPANKDFFERYSLFMKGSKAEDQMLMGTRYNFSDSENLDEFFVFFQKIQKKSGEGSADDPFGKLMGVETVADYDFSDSQIKRKCILGEPIDIDGEDNAFYQTMFGNLKYRSIVHLPGKAKKVKGDNLVSKKGDVVIFEYDMLEILSGKANTDFQIEYN